MLKPLVIVIAITIFLIQHVTSSPKQCTECLKDHTCNPPDCFCCRDKFVFPFKSSEIPQMVYFTFDDAVTEQVSVFYRELFDGSRKNPNGCPISMTLFISHDNTKYPIVNEFYRKGMEIASHSVTHSQLNTSNFLMEAKSQRENLAKLAGIPVESIKGWRSPYLKPTGDLQPSTLKELGYLYDATLTFSKRNLREKAPTPFTLDYGWPYDCKVNPCPAGVHNGFWEVPVVSLMDYKQQYDCVYVDGCMNPPPDETAAYQFLWENFNSYYTNSRIPFGINMHPSWFYYPDRLKAMDRFIQKLTSLNDVYIVNVGQVIEWLMNPTPLSKLSTFAPWNTCRSNITFSLQVQEPSMASSMTTQQLPSRALSSAEIRRQHILHRMQRIREELRHRRLNIDAENTQPLIINQQQQQQQLIEQKRLQQARQQQNIIVSSSILDRSDVRVPQVTRRHQETVGILRPQLARQQQTIRAKWPTNQHVQTQPQQTENPWLSRLEHIRQRHQTSQLHTTSNETNTRQEDTFPQTISSLISDIAHVHDVRIVQLKTPKTGTEQSGQSAISVQNHFPERTVQLHQIPIKETVSPLQITFTTATPNFARINDSLKKQPHFQPSTEAVISGKTGIIRSEKTLNNLDNGIHLSSQVMQVSSET
uniref:Chitin deacetylase isoform B n=1 Tax=Sinohyriopsis cumingii TaxID=165450 RepID=J7FHI0_SINCU|nr:chitin deacetylase isoform B [Sinohyriopsis cumingii]